MKIGSLVWHTIGLFATAHFVFASNVQVQPMHGASFYPAGWSRDGWERKRTREELDSTLNQLRRIQTDGFQMASPWASVWGLSSADAVFGWADQHRMPLVLTVQGWEFGKPGTMATYEQIVDPAKGKNLALAKKWAEKISEYECVRGVMLGNETWPTVGTPEIAPRFWGAIRRTLKKQYRGKIELLNANWRSNYEGFDQVTLPSADSPGYSDLRRIARRYCARFYDALIRKGFRPMLGNRIFYSTKSSRPDPFLAREAREFTCLAWDDVTALFPLWALKATADTTNLPLMNGEMHLYHDRYNYHGSASISRYRYFTSALMGEYWTASFTSSAWTKEKTRAVHFRTKSILKDLKTLDAPLRLLAKAYQKTNLQVLITEENWFYAEDGEPNVAMSRLRSAFVGNFESNPLAKIYSRMAMTGRLWNFLLEDDLERVGRGIVVVQSPALKRETAKRLSTLPKKVKIVFVNEIPGRDEYRRPLPSGVLQDLVTRAAVVPLSELTEYLGGELEEFPVFLEEANVTYQTWDRSEGRSAGYRVPYPRLELRKASGRSAIWLAVINHTPRAVSSNVPWADDEGEAVEPLTGRTVRVGRRGESVAFRPFETRIFRVPTEAGRKGGSQ